MKFGKKNLEQLVREEIKKTINESVMHEEMGMTVHPFDNDLANRPDAIPMENIYEQIMNATLIEMMAAYDEKKIREIIRVFSDKATQGPGGIGGRFTDEQVEEILLLVIEEVEEKIGINIASYIPQDREHPNYMDLD
jgi:hypothetical protein